MVKWIMRKCMDCGRYTMHTDKCPYCSGQVKIPHPAKFSPDDKYLSYRIKKKT